ncbi:MAG: YqiA/YcfP family alpha/beta fold hydrolase [Verrucomicrobiales bacterium]
MRYLYLHGFGSSPDSQKARFFAEQFAALGRRIECPRLVPGPFSEMTLSGQLEVIQAAAGDGEVCLIGSSMGGYLASIFAAQCPGQVARLALMAPAFGFPDRWIRQLAPGEFERWRDDGFYPVYNYAAEREDRIGFGLYEDAAAYDDFPQIGCPALIHHGRRDETVPVSYSEEFAALCPSAELRLLESDHRLTDVLPQIWSDVRAFFGFER